MQSLLGERYGDPVLPDRIPVKEYEKILSSAEKDHALLVERAAELAAKAEVCTELTFEWKDEYDVQS